MTGARATGEIGVGHMLGRYKLTKEIGRGSMGLVFVADDTRVGETLCVKVMNPALMRNREAVERFSREMVLARRVMHPGVCRMFELHEEGGTRFLTMEYVEGTCLRDFLGSDRPPLPVDQAVGLVARICDALAAAHDVGVVHRDLKPRNIMVRPDGSPVLLDFGIATAMDVATNLTMPGIALGTKHYIAPEVWAGRPATPKADQYALGVILFNCLTGKMPYRSVKEMSLLEEMRKGPPPPPSALRPEITPAVDKAVLRALAFSPDERFSDVRALSQALLTALGVHAPPATDKVPALARVHSLPNHEVTQVHTGSFAALHDDTGRASVDEADPVRRTDSSFPPITLPSNPGNSVASSSSSGGTPTPSVTLSGPGVHEPTLDAPRTFEAMGATQVLPALAEPPQTRPEPQVEVLREPAQTAVDEESIVVPGMMSRGTRIAALLSVAAAVLAVVAWLAWPAPAPPPVVAPVVVPPPVVAPVVVPPPVTAPPVAAPDAGVTPPPVVAPTVVAPTVVAPTVVAPTVVAPTVVAPTPAPLTAPVVEDEPTAAPAVRSTPRRGNGDRSSALAERGALDAAMRNKGVVAGDDAELDRLRAQAQAQIGNRRYADAEATLGTARARLDAVEVDKAFVKKKLVRFNARFDASSDDAARARANALAQDAVAALSAGRAQDANRALNEAMAALR